MTEYQKREIELLTLNIQAVCSHDQIIALCATLLEIELSTLRAWLARRRENLNRPGGLQEGR